MKLCKDCKHYDVRKGTEESYLPGYRFDGCSRAGRITDLVYGSTMETDDMFSAFCSEQRADVSHVPNRCGKEGKFWEAK
jgi:hypothetical protein